MARNSRHLKDSHKKHTSRKVSLNKLHRKRRRDKKLSNAMKQLEENNVYHLDHDYVISYNENENLEGCNNANNLNTSLSPNFIDVKECEASIADIEKNFINKQNKYYTIDNCSLENENKCVIIDDYNYINDDEHNVIESHDILDFVNFFELNNFNFVEENQKNNFNIDQRLKNIQYNHTDIEEQNDQCEIEKEQMFNKQNEDRQINENEVVDSNNFIVNYSHIMKEIHRIFDDHAVDKQCQFRDFIWLEEKTIKYGLLSKFFYECKNCNYKNYIFSEPTDDPKKVGINRAAVLATLTTGIGHSQLEKTCSFMNIHPMCDKTYTAIEENLLEDIEATALSKMKEAAEEEKKLAIESGHVTKEGIPYIDVVVDGSWMKRSYGTNYNSLSGCATIVGYRTEKVLFYSVKNKYCTVCARADAIGVNPKEHKCYKNWDIDAPSTGMESAIILEGFKCSIEMHGLIYRTVIADGDSSLYKAITDSNVYAEYDIIVGRIFCTNHLLRNLCKKLRTVAQTTQPRNEKRVAGFVTLRNTIKSNIGKIRQNVEDAVARRIEEPRPWEEKIKLLEEDILNIPSHIFGEHKNCKKLGFNCVATNGEEINNVPYLKRVLLYQRVEDIMTYLSSFSDSLLHRKTNNAAESVNALICVTIGAKRINYGLKSQYNARVGMAVVQKNTQQVVTEIHKNSGKNVPRLVTALEKRRQLKVARNKAARRSKGKKKSHFPYKFAGKNFYGPNCQKPDKSLKELDAAREKLFAKLEENQQNRKQVERDTLEQRKSVQWKSIRKNMLTASNFGEAIHWRTSTSCANKVKRILYPPTTQLDDNPAIIYGISQEKIAKEKLAKELKEGIEECGLFIDSVYSYLGGSPDGLIGNNGILEIKSPYGAANVTAEDAITSVRSVREILKKKDITKINENHNYYYQIQGLLHITNKEYCLFVINTPYSMKKIRIERDDEFWTKKMEKQLSRFYMDCLLPEILDSRYNRKMPIKDPEYTRNKKEKAQKNKIQRKNKVEPPVEDDNDNEDNTEENKIDSDLEIVSDSNDQSLIRPEDIWSIQNYLDTHDIDIQTVIDNVLPINSELNDESLDYFTRILQIHNNNFKIQSVQYMRRTACVEPVYTPAIQILGGSTIIKKGSKMIHDGTPHWRTVFFDGMDLHFYDSLRSTGKLTEFEAKYIEHRFPRKRNIIHEKMNVTQPDIKSCGVYAAAFALSIVLGEDPKDIPYSEDARIIRNHFIHIVNSRELISFPRRNI